MRALFFGTPDIAVPALDALARLADVVGVVCQPDRPAGRGLEVHAPPVKQRALSLGLLVHQPTKVRTPDFAAWVRERDAEVAVVLAYGRILTPEVLAGPRRGCLNLHASLLPRYRGAAPIQWAIVRGEKETGISLMQMDPGLDTGPVYSTRRLAIGPDETAGELAPRMAALAATMVEQDLQRVLDGQLTATPQLDAEATLAPLLGKDDGRIDWTRPAGAVHDLARGMTPWPGAFTKLEGKTLKVLGTRISAHAQAGAAPGAVLVADKHGILVACGEGAVEIVRAQVEGRKALSAPELVAGRTVRAGMTLG